jgi:hypothetical protein
MQHRNELYLTFDGAVTSRVELRDECTRDMRMLELLSKEVDGVLRGLVSVKEGVVSVVLPLV